MSEESANTRGLPRRALLRLGAAGGAGAALVAAQAWAGPLLAQRGLLSADGAFAATSTALGDVIVLHREVPDEPADPLAVQRPAADPEGAGARCRSRCSAPGGSRRDRDRASRTRCGNERHQIWPSQVGYPDPIVYKIDVLVRTHAFTTSQVLPIDSDGRPTVSFDSTGKTYAAGTKRTLPPSTIYGFNGTFPGPDDQRRVRQAGRWSASRTTWTRTRSNLDRQDFGAPDWSFLTHLHNGHTAPESDGNPHYSMTSGPKHRGLPAGDVRRQPVPELAGRRRRPGEAELLLVPRPPDGPHRLERLQGHGRPVPDLRPEERHGHGGRAAGAAAARRPHRQPGRLLRRRLRHPAGLLRLPARRRRHHAQGHPRRAGRVPGRQEPGDAPGVVGQDLLQALPQPRVRRRHLHRQRHGLPGAWR